MLQFLLINLGIKLVESYIESTNSKQDDKVLNIVKKGAEYLSVKDNNSLTQTLCDEVKQTNMRGK